MSIPIQPLVPAAAGDCAACSDGLDFAIDFAFQPIVDVRQRQIVGHEALVRGEQGEGAESVLARLTPQTIYAFDQLVRVTAIEKAAALGMRERLSINFLANAVRDSRHCVRSTFSAARAFNFPLDRIGFEVAGGERVEDCGHLLEIFNAYREYGFQTAYDDFGASFVGLNLLAQFQPDIVKLDIELVRAVHRDPARQAIVKAVVDMCGALGSRVLAKGVETRAERDYLFNAGVDLMQGYYFCRPVFRGLGTIDPALWP